MKIPLCIMVKDEEVNIMKTLNSCKDIISAVYLLDTGSSDNTVKVAADFCRLNGIKFDMMCSEFKYFGPTRNKLLEFAEKDMDDGIFYMVLDANDELVFKNKDFLDKISSLMCDNRINTIYIRSSWFDIYKNVTEHDKIFLLRSKRGIRYKGYCHEDIENTQNINKETNRLEGVYVYQDRSLDDIRSLKRTPQDIEYLKQELLDYCDDLGQLNRALYFLARIYSASGEYDNAKLYLERLFDLKKNNPKFTGFNEELLYMSHYTYTYVLEKTGGPWSEQMIHLLKAYSYNQNKIEAIVAIVNYYCDVEEYNTAYIFSKYICELPYTVSSTNLIPLYKFSRWCLHAIICVKINKIKEGKKSFDKIEHENIPKVYEEHYRQLSSVYNFLGNSINKKIVLIFGGYSHYKWDPSMLFNGVSLGGSETVVSYNALLLSRRKDYSVVVCCDCEKEIYYKGINIIPISKYDLFISLYKIDMLIVHRFCDYLRYDENINKCILVLEDVYPVYKHIDNGNICFSTKPDTTFNYNDKLKHIIFKTNWHMDFNKLKNYTKSIPNNTFKVIGNGIDINRFTKFGREITKTKYRFIYTSCPSRGALRIANMIPKILSIIPEASFYFFMDIDNYPEIKDALSNKNNVFISTRVSQETLALEILKSDIWLYPTNFCETFCITALEMQLGGVLCICSELAGLKDTVGDRGILVKQFDKDEEFLNIIKDLSESKIKKNVFLENGFNWAIKQNWDEIVKNLHNSF